MLLDILRPYILAFITIFIAIDVIENIPLFLTQTERLSHKQKNKTIRESIIFALVLTIIFILCGRYFFRIIGITIADFKIAGGILLLVLSVNLLLPRQTRFYYHRRHADLGIFPLATQLIAGPELLILSLLLLEGFGLPVTLVALILNMALASLALQKSDIIKNFIGENGLKFISQIFEILLAALAVMMMRQGALGIFFK